MGKEMAHAQSNDLRSFSQVIAFEAGRSIGIINAVDDIIYASKAAREALDAITGKTYEFILQLQRLEGAVDKDRSILNSLEKSRDVHARVFDDLTAMRERVLLAAGDQDDEGMLAAYDAVLDALAATHNALNDFCWALSEHEADFEEPVPGTFTNAEDLFSAIHQGA